MNDVAARLLVPLVYLLSAVLFIVGLKRLSRVRTARGGNLLAALAMFLAVAGTLLELGRVHYAWIGAGFVLGSAVGAVAALRVPMTGMPGLVAVFNGFGGAASALVAVASFWFGMVEPAADGPLSDIVGPVPATMALVSILIGMVTFSGSMVAYLKVEEKVGDRPTLLPGRHLVSAALFLASVALGVGFAFAAAGWVGAAWLCLALVLASLLLGVLLVIPIGGADMPVVIALLNALSGVAASATGFLIDNLLLIISGALVGASGLFLTRLMCTAMNRSPANVLLGGFGAPAASARGEYKNLRPASIEEAALVLENARSLLVVPGYGMAVAQAHFAMRELAELLQKQHVRVRYAIHPVAGRMPGHMNVLLAEANIPYEQMVEMEQINPEFAQTDVALVIGANDVVNPAAEKSPDSPLYGMPILQVYRARTVFVIKRGLGAGFSGVKNELFEYPNTRMLFGDARQVLQNLVAELKAST
jgi:NAD(P) transhydrogenase subunit beta